MAPQSQQQEEEEEDSSVLNNTQFDCEKAEQWPKDAIRGRFYGERNLYFAIEGKQSVCF